jgi:DNA-binding CsgD family transcriptional regulator
VEQGQRAVEVIDLMASVAESLKADRPAGELICASLTRVIGAESAAWIAIRDDEGPEVVSAHPSPADADSLIATVLAASWGSQSTQLMHWRAGRIGDVAVVAPDELPGTGPSRAHRLLALSKRRGFTGEDLSLLAATIPALTIMQAQVIASSERRRRAVAQAAAAKQLGLSAREMGVLQLLSQGLLATSIAAKLELSPRTVHKHLGNIYEKMGVHDRLVAVQIARQHGLVNSDS